MRIDGRWGVEVLWCLTVTLASRCRRADLVRAFIRNRAVGSSRQISSADHRNTTVGSKQTHLQILLDQMYSWASGVIWREFCWILEALEFQVIGCDGIGQRNPGKYRNPGGRNRTKIRLGEICQISPRHLHSQPAQRKGGGGIIHGILALSSITLGEPRR